MLSVLVQICRDRGYEVKDFSNDAFIHSQYDSWHCEQCREGLFILRHFNHPFLQGENKCQTHVQKSSEHKKYLTVSEVLKEIKRHDEYILYRLTNNNYEKPSEIL